MSSKPLVFVGTGTDKRFPYPRMLEWVEAWDGRSACLLVVQAGITPTAMDSVSALAPEAVDELMQQAVAAVLQGGPGGIMRARDHGLRPIVVPRLASLGEVVDDHQVEFSTWAAARGWIELVTDRDALHRALDRVLTEDQPFRFPPEPSPLPGTIERLRAHVDRLMAP